MYTLEEEQVIDTSLQRAWDFIRDPQNLNRITPEDMQFEVLQDLPPEMYEGLLIKYRVRIPFFGKQIWVSELKHIQHKRSFVDEQRVGPYKFWYHYHEITEVDEGVKFTDRVSYQMPFGILGKWVHHFLVKRLLQQIFTYRREALEKIFSST
ncbi:MAG: SRPBCC family protein [Anaerolineales bacterium]